MENNIQNKALELFYKICEIPHGSKQNIALKKYLLDTLKNIDKVEVASDIAGNIYAYKGSPKICLQGHYDMVCVGKATEGVKPYIKDNFLYARDSSLGADNGIALAYMIELIKKYDDIEILITNDEEIGMIGANHIDTKICDIKSEILLNLDSEDINEIIVGCAGGADATLSSKIESKEMRDKIYHIKDIDGYFKGGHSGIEIHKNKKNVIKEFGKVLEKANIIAIDNLKAGEKRNSIPTHLSADIVLKDTKFDFEKYGFSIESIKESSSKAIMHDTTKLKNLINSIHSGVYNIYDDMVIGSLNLSILSLAHGSLKIEMMLRANEIELLKSNISMLGALASMSDSLLEISDIYMPWERSLEEDSTLLGNLAQIYKKHSIAPKIAQIHAGLECGILLNAYKHKNLVALSIGPSIYSPHSIKECLDMDSFYKFGDILKDIFKEKIWKS